MASKKKPIDPTRSDAWLHTLGPFMKAPKQTHQFFRRNLTSAAEKRQQNRKNLVVLWSEQKGSLASTGLARNLKRQAFVFGGKQGKGEKKAMIVTADASSFGTEYHCWAYYPKPVDAMKFAGSIKSVEFDSPTRQFPGSVGIMLGHVSGNSVEIHYMQGSFSQRKAPNLTRGLVSKYMGWREHILRHIFQDASAKGINEITLKSDVWEKKIESKSRRQAKIFLRVAKEHGFKTSFKRGSGRTELKIIAKKE